ncbi:MAG: DHH family phosphoesterase [Candidatus Desulfofervidaceae bacterium]|nr:DHH family phosphoesterase [Candidatus Desulfofervidaceae bacterium]
MSFRTTKEKLEHLLSILDVKDKLLIVISPDPDAISSAWALKRLLTRKVHTITIAFIRETKRLDNLAMIKLLRIPLKPLSGLDISFYTKLAIVDSQPHHFPELESLSFDIIIDHHPLKSKIETSFVDIEPDCGATATLLTEYLRSMKIKPSTYLATALFYGIKTDTQNFALRGTERDIKAFRYLFNYINQTLIRKIETSELSLDNIHYFKKAFNAMQVSWRYHRIFVFLGEIDNPDICVILADFFLRIYEISWSIVAGTYQDRIIVIFRSDGYRKNAGSLAEKAFGKIGQAGGHKEMARAEIPFGNLENVLASFTVENLRSFLLHQITKAGSENGFILRTN